MTGASGTKSRSPLIINSDPGIKAKFELNKFIRLLREIDYPISISSDAAKSIGIIIIMFKIFI